jgi:anti-anti-sigma regulatory factor
MLRISVTTGRRRAAVTLEGSLSGPWVDELARTLEALGDEQRSPIVLRLASVTFIDGAGRLLLRSLCARGVLLRASGCMNRAIVAEITSAKDGR